MNNFHLVILFASSILAGLANALAGGGTFFSFPALTGMGLTSLIANLLAMGTGRVAPGPVLQQWPALPCLTSARRKRIAEAALIRLKLAYRTRIPLLGERASLQGQLAVIALEGDEEIAQLFRCIDVRPANVKNTGIGSHEDHFIFRDGPDAI